LSCCDSDVVDFIGKLHILERQLASLVGDAFPKSREGERLARGAPDKNVRGFNVPERDLQRKPAHIPVVGYIGVVMG
jgi:hypothetical protein